MESVSAENRRSERIQLRIPVKLEVMDGASIPTKILLGYTANINRHGLRLDIGSETPLLKDSQVIIHMDGTNSNVPTKLNAKLLWHANSQCGVNFHEEFHDIQDLIESLSSNFNITPAFLKRFFPY